VLSTGSCRGELRSPEPHTKGKVTIIMTFKDYLKSIKDKKVTVVGAGISNTPLIEALCKADIYVSVRDMRTYDELGEVAQLCEKLGAKLILGADYLQDISEDIIFRTPGLMPSNPALKKAVENGATLTSEMEVFFDVCPCYTIGVTGSDGKTTTTSIIAEILKNGGKTVHLGGNIGTPLLTKADDMGADDIAVVELSSFQLITMKKCPNTAIVTNLTPNHLDVHKDMDEYIGAKRRIFINQNSTDRSVFNLDNEVTLSYSKCAVTDDVLMFSRQEKVKNGVYMKRGVIYDAHDDVRDTIMNVRDIVLPGVHNIENYMAAFAAVRGLVSYDVMRETAQTFAGVAHRIEFVRELAGVKFYNDSIASSPTRAIAGLKSFDQKVVLIAGGKGKGISFDDFGAQVNKRVKKLVLTGATAEQIFDAVCSATPPDGERLQIIICNEFEDAVKKAYEISENGDIVLLSPACTSFDKFKNFEERGNYFKELVLRF